MNKSQKIKYRISNKQIEQFGDYFQNNLDRIFSKGINQYLTAYVKNHWKQIVGSVVAKHSKVSHVANKVLYIHAWPDAWANEIKLLSEELISKINVYAGRNFIKFINFIKFYEQKSDLPLKIINPDIALKKNIKLKILNQEEKNKIKDSLSKVKDKDLKKVLKEYAIISKKMQNYRRDNLIKCKVCGKFKGEEICEECKIKKETEIKNKLVKLLRDLPYYSFADAKKEIPELSPDLFTKIRLELLQIQAKKVKFKDGVTLESKILAMLYKSLPPEFLSDIMVYDTLKKLRYDLAEPFAFSKEDFIKNYAKKSRK